MPCLEIGMPSCDIDRKRSLTAALTSAFVRSTGMPEDIFGIRYHEYEHGEAAKGGELWDGKQARPYLHMLFYCPRLKRAVKQEAVKQFTAAFCESIGQPDWKPVIHICEHPYDNVGVAGELLSDSREECAKSVFYYEL